MGWLQNQEVSVFFWMTHLLWTFQTKLMNCWEYPLRSKSCLWFLICVCTTPCECSRSYVRITGRPLCVHIQECRYNLRKSLMEKSKLDQCTYEGQGIGWEEAEILKIETNSRYRKFKKSAHMACTVNLISQLSLELWTLQILLITKEFGKKSWRELMECRWLLINSWYARVASGLHKRYWQQSFSAQLLWAPNIQICSKVLITISHGFFL